MSRRTITIEPVTRIEGEVKVAIFLNERGEVERAYYQVVEFRGYEEFCKNRPVEDLPRITSTVCGVCSWAHHLASAKAVDALYGRKPTETAAKLREFGYQAHIIDSHLLHFVVLSLPDFALSDAPPELRNIAGLLRRNPELVKKFIESRKILRNIEETFGGKAIHPAFVLPGGVSKKLTRDDVDKLSKLCKDLLDITTYIYEYFIDRILKSKNFNELLYNEAYRLRTYYIGLVDNNNYLNFYDGFVRIIDSKGREVTKFEADKYTDYIAEHAEDWSYSKFPYLKSLGWRGFVEEYICRAGPLARLNVADDISTERAREAYKYMVETLGGKPIHNTIAYHWSRLIECIHASEKMIEFLNDDSILREDIVNTSGSPRYEGVGIVEAPRGLLVHHYQADENFIAREVNIITPTAINNAAINAELQKVASTLIKGFEVPEKILNLVETSIRAYDPCNACATHTLSLLSSRGGITVLIYDNEGRLIEKLHSKPPRLR
ncbi:MAG: Ni/Fe hydrogenase subunit alpha [Thermoprotei archaeon]|nr:MAG: Ni/Fe hydrogenase subunit alpha [Thermoprotei archaeon]